MMIDVQKTRARLSAKVQRQKSVETLDPREAAITLLSRWPAAQFKAQSVAGFWPIKDEIDVRPLLCALQQAGHVTALPRIVRKAHPLAFHVWEEADALDRGAYGTAEPKRGGRVMTPDIVLLPLLAFSPSGYRLGYGGGFYDRTLQALRKTSDETAKAVFACGVAYDGQETAFVPTDSYDEKLDAILTPTGFRMFS